MPTVSEQLLAARTAANLSLQQVVDATKLKADQIVALEEGNYSVFPAPVYIRGSIRTYAKLLKMDVPKLMSQLDEEFSTSKELSGPPPLTPPANGFVDWLMLQLSRLDWRIIAGLGAVVVVLIVAWSLVRPSNRVKKADPLSKLGARPLCPPAVQPGRTDPDPGPHQRPGALIGSSLHLTDPSTAGGSTAAQRRTGSPWFGRLRPLWRSWSPEPTVPR